LKIKFPMLPEDGHALALPLEMRFTPEKMEFSESS